MSVLVDTGVLYADQDVGSTRHEAAEAALDSVYNGELGRPYVSEYVYDEAITLTLQRSGSFEMALELGRRIRGAEAYPTHFELLHLSREVFDSAVQTFERYDDQQLSFTDAAQIAQYEEDVVDAILSFDDDFDGLVERISPNDL